MAQANENKLKFKEVKQNKLFGKCREHTITKMEEKDMKKVVEFLQANPVQYLTFEVHQFLLVGLRSRSLTCNAQPICRLGCNLLENMISSNKIIPNLQVRK